MTLIKLGKHQHWPAMHQSMFSSLIKTLTGTTFFGDLPFHDINSTYSIVYKLYINDVAISTTFK